MRARSRPIVYARRDGRDWCWTALSPRTFYPVAEGVAPSRAAAIRTGQTTPTRYDKALICLSVACVAGIVAIRRWR